MMRKYRGDRPKIIDTLNDTAVNVKGHVRTVMQNTAAASFETCKKTKQSLCLRGA